MKENFRFTNTKGVEYEIVFRKPHKAYGEIVDGLCLDPSEPDPKIYINPYLTKKSELNTSIHEIAHAFFWDKSETDIAYAVTFYIKMAGDYPKDFFMLPPEQNQRRKSNGI